MRGWFVLAVGSALVLLGACRREPDFDERYAEANRRIEERAQALDRDMASGAASPAPSSAPPRR